jgi:AcrR family transcriptional regulator
MAPRSTEQFEAMRENTIQRITHSALSLFSQKGYKNTSVSEIAKEAGISKGLIYNYYKSKEEVLNGVLQSFEAMEQEMTQHGKYTLEQMLDQYFQMIEHQKGFMKMLFSLSLDVNELPSVKKFIHKKTEKSIELYASKFEELGFEDPIAEAWFFSSLIEGTALIGIVAEEDYPIDKMKKKIYERYKIKK